MTFYYEVFHEMNPKGAVILAFEIEQSSMRVKDKACKDGHFQWKYYTELCVRKTKQTIPLEAFGEVEKNDGNQPEIQ